MTLLPQVRDQLDAAAYRKVETTERTRGFTVRWDVASIGRRTRSVMHVVAMALLVSCSLAIVVGAVVLLHGNRPRPAANATGSASQAAAGPTAQPLVRTLGVLRRAQTRTDRDPGLLRIFDGHRSFTAAVGSPVVSLIRLATVTPWGSKVFLVPLKPLTARAIAKLPVELRAPALRTLRRQGNVDSLAVFELGRAPGGGVCCATATQIEKVGDNFWGYGPTRALLVVPDGVSRVTLMLPRPVPGGRADQSPRTVTATVHSNVVAFEIHRAVNDPFSNMTWYGPTGEVVKRIHNGHVLSTAR
jgi:hypothetical protein